MDFSLNPFYRKYVDAAGLPVVSSGAPDDVALERACKLLLNMLSKRLDVRDKLIELKVRFVVIGKDEGTADVPEYGFRDRPQAEKDSINARTRGTVSYTHLDVYKRQVAGWSSNQRNHPCRPVGPAARRPSGIRHSC